MTDAKSNLHRKRVWFLRAAMVSRILMIAAAFTSAVFWFLSTTITTPTEFHISLGHSASPYSSTFGDTGLTARSLALTELGTELVKQSKLNEYAAWCAGASALLEILVIFFRWRARCATLATSQRKSQRGRATETGGGWA
jgi:hypothetical protein